MVPNKTGQGMGHIYHTTWAGVFKGGLAKSNFFIISNNQNAPWRVFSNWVKGF